RDPRLLGGRSRPRSIDADHSARNCLARTTDRPYPTESVFEPRPPSVRRQPPLRGSTRHARYRGAGHAVLAEKIDPCGLGGVARLLGAWESTSSSASAFSFPSACSCLWPCAHLPSLRSPPSRSAPARLQQW